MTHISSKFIAHDPHSCTYMGSEKGHYWCYWWCIWMDLVFSSLFGTRNGWMANQMVGKLPMEPKHCQSQQQHQHLYSVFHVSNGRLCSTNIRPHPLIMLRASEQRWNHLDFFKHGLYQRIPGDDQPLCFPVYLVLYPIVSKQEFVQLNMKPEVHQFHQWSPQKRGETMWNHPFSASKGPNNCCLGPPGALRPWWSQSCIPAVASHGNISTRDYPNLGGEKHQQLWGFLR